MTASVAVEPKVKERPIIFSASMVRALLDGRKTQTRRIVKQTPIAAGMNWSVWYSEKIEAQVGHEAFAKLHCPYGKPGDRLWVRETFTTFRTRTPEEERSSAEVIRRFDNMIPGDDIVRLAKSFPRSTGPREALYKADFGEWADNPDSDLGPWRPSIFMPRWASRITLELTAVRVERLNDISEADAKAEGAMFFDGRPVNHHGWRHDYSDVFETAQQSFAHLWEALCGPGSWAKNPFCWVLEFRRSDGQSA